MGGAAWKTIGRTTVARFGRYLTLERHRVELPDGRVIDDWPWVIAPDYVNIVPLTPEGNVLCFRQRKYGVEGPTLALIGGYLEEGEDPLAGGRRELMEETGYQAGHWESLGSYRVDSNRGAGTAHLYLATGAVKTGQIVSDDLEEQQLLSLTERGFEEALEKGEFRVLAWTAGAALALRRMKTGPGSTHKRRT